VADVRRSGLALPLILLAVALAWPAYAAVMPSVSKQLTGQAVPDARSETLDGRPFALSSLRGHPVLVTLFASWCPVCQSEQQEILAVHEEYAPRGLQFVGVLLDPRETPDTVVQAREALRRNPLPFPVVMMNDSMQRALANKFGEFPATYLITFALTMLGLWALFAAGQVGGSISHS
jgi:thiol-disulfide isomerase/thioredoxin